MTSLVKRHDNAVAKLQEWTLKRRRAVRFEKQYRDKVNLYERLMQDSVEKTKSRQGPLRNLSIILARNRLPIARVARDLGVSRQIIHGWIGGSTPNGDNQRMLLKYLQEFEPKLTLEDLYQQEGQP
jgi:hypothetical protein